MNKTKELFKAEMNTIKAYWSDFVIPTSIRLYDSIESQKILAVLIVVIFVMAQLVATALIAIYMNVLVLIKKFQKDDYIIYR